MNWKWKGEYYPLKHGEFLSLQRQLEQDTIHGNSFVELPLEEQLKLLKNRVKDYCRKTYSKVKIEETEVKQI